MNENMKTTLENLPDILTPEDIAEIMRINKSAVNRIIKSGDIEVIRYGSIVRIEKAKFREWLVFKSSALSLDRTVFNYTIIANCSDGQLNLTMSRMNYAYEMDRDDSSGLQTSAEEWITDEYALNKARTKLQRYSGKFRVKTIDRKDEIFQIFRNALKN